MSFPFKRPTEVSPRITAIHSDQYMGAVFYVNGPVSNHDRFNPDFLNRLLDECHEHTLRATLSSRKITNVNDAILANVMRLRYEDSVLVGNCAQVGRTRGTLKAALQMVGIDPAVYADEDIPPAISSENVGTAITDLKSRPLHFDGPINEAEPGKPIPMITGEQDAHGRRSHFVKTTAHAQMKLADIERVYGLNTEPVLEELDLVDIVAKLSPDQKEFIRRATIELLSIGLK